MDVVSAYEENLMKEKYGIKAIFFSMSCTFFAIFKDKTRMRSALYVSHVSLLPGALFLCRNLQAGGNRTAVPSCL